jgi:hypothetical protein
MDLEKNEIFFLKVIKKSILEKLNLPYNCLSIELHDNDSFKIYYLMRNFPFEVYFNRYEIIDEIEKLLHIYCRLTTNKKIVNMRIYIDHRSESRNLLNFVM